MQRVWALVGQLTRAQRKELIDRLTTQTAASETASFRMETPSVLVEGDTRTVP